MKKLAVTKTIKNLESYAIGKDSIHMKGGNGDEKKGTGNRQTEKGSIPPPYTS